MINLTLMQQVYDFSNTFPPCRKSLSNTRFSVLFHFCGGFFFIGECHLDRVAYISQQLTCLCRPTTIKFFFFILSLDSTIEMIDFFFLLAHRTLFVPLKCQNPMIQFIYFNFLAKQSQTQNERAHEKHKNLSFEPLEKLLELIRLPYVMLDLSQQG